MTNKATAFKAGNINSISLEVARQNAPAIFATEPASYINQNRYHFTPSPYRMGNTLLARVRGLLAPYLDPRSMVG